MEFWMTEKRAHAIAGILRAICCLMFTIAAACAVLLILGRISVSLTTPEGHYDRALLVEEDHDVKSRAFFVSVGDTIYLETEGSVSPLTRILLPVMGLLRVFPFGFCFFMMIRFFGNIQLGKVFVLANAKLFLSSAAVLLAFSVATPLLNVVAIPALIGALTDNTLSVHSQPDIMGIFFGAILLIAAYVFHYGIYLQDEADHTL